MKRVAVGIIGFLAVLMMWLAGAAYVRSTRTDLPSQVVDRLYPLPHHVFVAAGELHWAELTNDIKFSSLRVFLGFFAAATVALPIGFAIGRLRFVAEALEPANDFLRYLPVAGFSSLAIFLLGTGNVSAILVVFVGTVFHLTVATADSVRRVPGAYLDLGRTMSYSPIQRLYKIIIPTVAPAVFDNLRVAIGWAWSYVTLAEIMGTEGGLGHAIEVSRRYIRIDQVLLWLVIIGMLGLATDQAMRAIARRWFRWAAEGR